MFERIVFRGHAIRRMHQRHIAPTDIRHVLEAGTVVEDYPTDTPYPSRLVLGWLGTRPLHVVAADHAAEQTTIIITVYEPSPERWEADFRTRRTP